MIGTCVPRLNLPRPPPGRRRYGAGVREDLTAGLVSALEPVLGAVEVTALHRLTGGASRETWAFDAVDADGLVHELVLRRDPPGRPGPAGSMHLEATAMRLAEGAGVPVPEVLVDADEAAPWGSAGLVMRRVPGEALGRRLLRDERFAPARRVLVRQCADALARLHAVPADQLADAPEHDPLDTMRALLHGFDEPVPTFEYALRWLDRRRPDPTGRSIVHGDFRLGNLLVEPDGLRAVLDWELLHVGDPAEDLGWLCVRAWRFGADAPVGGLGDRDELLAAYADAGGAPLSLDDLRWWEAYGTLRWGIICLTQVAAHLSGAVRSVELAAIGRRVAETEWDLLLLLAPSHAAAALVAADGAGPTTTAPPAVLHGRPTSLELVQAVREFLADRVVSETEGSMAYHGRVAANVLGMVERELARGPEPQQRRSSALAGLGCADEADLCAAIRSGTFDGRTDELVAALAEGVVERVRVANPRYLADGGHRSVGRRSDSGGVSAPG